MPGPVRRLGQPTPTATLSQALLSSVNSPLPTVLVDYLLSTRTLDELLRRAADQPGPIFRRLLTALSIECKCATRDRRLIPRTGPVLAFANHPHGLLDGLALGSLLDEIRPDVKILANSALSFVPQLTDRIIPIDPFRRASTRSANVQAIRTTTSWLLKGGAVVVFPAGEVSRFALGHWDIRDGPWSDLLAYLVQRTRAKAIPAYVAGSNGVSFYAASLLIPSLGTALLPRELLKKRRSRVNVLIGTPIDPDVVTRFENKQGIVNYFRFRTHILRQRLTPTASRPIHPRTIAALTDPIAVAQDVDSLPPASRLYTIGPLSVFVAEATQIPHGLREIARLRELAFRAEGEGTGLSLDMDRFDTHYQHLFLWRADTKQIVGAYRFGGTDEILPKHGANGIYSSTLFSFPRQWLTRHFPALELGRSFVRVEYQRSHNALLALWRGIGAFVERHPHYRFLFGPVSMSGTYSEAAKQFTVAFFASAIRHRDQTIRGRRPFTAKSIPHHLLESLDFDALDLSDVHDIVADIDADGRGLPVLFRQYLAMGGTILAFNVDNKFSDSLDGLLLVDLLEGNTPRLERYLGHSCIERVARFHGGAREAA